jgi:hypothetical protein
VADGDRSSAGAGLWFAVPSPQVGVRRDVQNASAGYVWMVGECTFSTQDGIKVAPQGPRAR